MLETLTGIAGLAALRWKAEPATDVAARPKYHRVLEVLQGANEPLSNKAIADRAGVGREWVARVLPELRAAGLVKAARQWKELLNELTPIGREALASVPAPVEEDRVPVPVPEPEEAPVLAVEQPSRFSCESFQAILMRRQTTWPVDLDGIGQDLGVLIELRQDLGQNSGMIAREVSDVGEVNYHIALNGKHSLVRRRFTQAHEYAHLELHRERIGDGVLEDALYRSGSFSDPQEKEADRRAAEIVMPQHLVRQAFAEQGDASTLAKMFQVSRAAMDWRLEELGLADRRWT